MTTSWPPQNIPPAPRHRDPLAVIAAAFISGTVILTLVITAITFAALALAFPLAEHLGPWISARDLAIAQSVGEFWWVFAGFAVASIAAAVGVAVATIRWMVPSQNA